MFDKTTGSRQEPAKDKKLVRVELPEEVWKVISESLTSELKNVKTLNLEYPALWKVQDEIAEALKQAISTINKAISGQR